MSVQKCDECVKAFVDELKGIADNIENTDDDHYAVGSSNGSAKDHDVKVLKKVAALFERMFATEDPD